MPILRMCHSVTLYDKIGQNECCSLCPIVVYGCIALWNIQQLKFHSSAKLQRRDYLSFVLAEGDVFPIDVPVALVQHLNKSAFRSVSVAQQTVSTYVVGKCGKEQ